MIAALIGLAVAAIIVFLVFGQASEQGGLGGAASRVEGTGRQSEAPASACGSIAPVDVYEPGSVRAAAAELPPITAQGRTVRPSQQRERDWFGRVHAAASRCITSVTVDDRVIRLDVSFSARMTAEHRAAHAYAILSKVFDPPFARSRVIIKVSGTPPRQIDVSAAAWRSFQRSRASFGLEPSLAGLAAARQQLGIRSDDLRITGF